MIQTVTMPPYATPLFLAKEISAKVTVLLGRLNSFLHQHSGATEVKIFVCLFAISPRLQFQALVRLGGGRGSVVTFHNMCGHR